MDVFARLYDIIWWIFKKNVQKNSKPPPILLSTYSHFHYSIKCWINIPCVAITALFCFFYRMKSIQRAPKICEKRRTTAWAYYTLNDHFAVKRKFLIFFSGYQFITDYSKKFRQSVSKRLTYAEKCKRFLRYTLQDFF